jgi:bifunctional UDP-N-acetylglucosamine pyrophosphorylase/glucosamine-1-phosphate N-acetyltransferase
LVVCIGCPRSQVLDLTTIVLAIAGDRHSKSTLPIELQAVAGQPMVRYVLEVAQALEPAGIAVVVGSGAEGLERMVETDSVTFLEAGQAAWAPAVQHAAPALEGQGQTVLVLPGDMPLVQPDTLRRLVEHHRDRGAVVSLLAPEDQAAGEAHTGIACFRDEWLWPNLAPLVEQSAQETTLSELVARARDQGAPVVTVLGTDPQEITHIGDRLQLAKAEAVMRQRINESWMLEGVTLVHPEATYIEAGVEIGAGTIVWPNTLLQGQTRIGTGCTIGPGSVIRDSSVGDRCRVELSVVEQAIMEEGSDVGPFGHLRKGAHLGPGAHMGNFGEVKNSYLGPGVKMGHMSYLGDATVGAGANIGAGTITCNYDGKRKHPTVVGEAAFIGSDTMLVAPVQIGDGAKTGAGSVVTHDVPSGSIAYGVPARIKTRSATPAPMPAPTGTEREANPQPSTVPQEGRGEGRAEESEVE